MNGFGQITTRRLGPIKHHRDQVHLAESFLEGIEYGLPLLREPSENQKPKILFVLIIGLVIFGAVASEGVLWMVGIGVIVGAFVVVVVGVAEVWVARRCPKCRSRRALEATGATRNRRGFWAVDSEWRCKLCGHTLWRMRWMGLETGLRRRS